MDNKDYKITGAIYCLAFSILVSGLLIGNSFKQGFSTYSSGIQQTISNLPENLASNYQPNHDIVDFSQAAKYLQLTEEDFVKVIQNDKSLPYVKVKGRYIFSRRALSEWVSKSNFRLE